MNKEQSFEIFLLTAPGLEDTLLAEVRTKGFKQPKTVAGGVVLRGGWSDVWRANLWVRGAGRVLARLDSFRVQHLAQLDARARLVDWRSVLRRDVSFRVEATCKKSRIYHSGAAAERIARAIEETLGARYAEDGEILVKARLEYDICTISIDTSGEPLHKRGAKLAVNQAPMRETMAASFLLACGYNGREPVLDPMCGSGTFVIEAAEIAAHLNPGRFRSFAFERLATFDPEAWQKMRGVQSAREPAVRFYGSDRDAGAVDMSRENATRAGVSAWTSFDARSISALERPEGPAGLIIVNPPYGARLGDKKKLQALYRAMGQVFKQRFAGWRVGIITTEASLAHASGLPFLPTAAPIQHGGLRVTLYRTDPLPEV